MTFAAASMRLSTTCGAKLGKRIALIYISRLNPRPYPLNYLDCTVTLVKDLGQIRGLPFKEVGSPPGHPLTQSSKKILKELKKKECIIHQQGNLDCLDS